MSVIALAVEYTSQGCIVAVANPCEIRLNEVVQFINPVGKVLITSVVGIDRVSVVLEGDTPENCTRLLFSLPPGSVEPGHTIRPMNVRSY